MKNRQLDLLVILLTFATPIAILIFTGILMTQFFVEFMSAQLAAGGY